MYIVSENGTFKSAQTSNGGLLEIGNPKYYIYGKLFEIKNKNCFGDNLAEYSDDLFSVKIEIKKETDNLFCLKRIWRNKSEQAISFQTVFELGELFGAEKYLIPCVSFNGNSFGKGKEPKGLECKGEPWVFSYDRVSIPSCTLTENKDFVAALFASTTDNESLRSACSIVKGEKGYIQRLIHPEKDAPYTYCSKDLYEVGNEKFIDLLPNEEFRTEMYVYLSKPIWKNFGVASLLDEIVEMPQVDKCGKKDYKLIWNRSISFAKSLICDCAGKKGFIIGYLPDGKGGFEYRDDQHFQLAWCGQNALLCRMLIKDYILYGHKENLDTAIEIMDNWTSCCTTPTGLMAVQMQDYPMLCKAVSDTCNLGYGAFELLEVYEILKSIGIEKEAYFKAAKGICDFFVDNYLEKSGFGKLWSMQGECLEDGGTIGAFLIMPLCRIFEMTGEHKYLETAEKAIRLYSERDLNNFVCTAGALDTCCVDKETSAPLIFSAIMLYEITGNCEYIDIAKKAAYYFSSWMYHYVPVYEDDNDIKKFDVNIIGLTAVSTQHHHLDPYAGLVVPWLYKLAEYTDDKRWERRAELMGDAIMQMISDGKTEVHNLMRPEGGQNEAIFHCRWMHGKGYVNAEKARGNLNDWLVAWPCAFRLNCIDMLINQSEPHS